MPSVTITMTIPDEVQDKLRDIKEELGADTIADAIGACIEITHNLSQEVKNGSEIFLIAEGESELRPLILDGDETLEIEIED